MALPTSGQLSLADIYEEQNGLTPQAAGDEASLNDMSFEAGFSTPHLVSDFYGYSKFQPSWLLGYLGGTINYSNEGTQTYTINCFYKEDGYAYNTGSTYFAQGAFTSRAPSVWQDIDNVTPSSFVTNDDGTNKITIYRSISAFNPASIEVNFYAPTVGSLTYPFSNVSYSTSNGSVTSQIINTGRIYLYMATSSSSLTSHSITIEFKL